ncbi:MAG: CrcB family protein, partial [Firmicutes bacterium]|nr:CrcB family protein [Bacillota bacterium]
MWQKLMWLALTGAAGTLCRYGLSGWANRLAARFGNEGVFPWGTLAVNSLGCLLFGLVWGFVESRLHMHEWRVIILAGFLGAFTTFSTFAFESGQLVEDGQWRMLLINLAAQNIMGIALAILG